MIKKKEAFCLFFNFWERLETLILQLFYFWDFFRLSQNFSNLTHNCPQEFSIFGDSKNWKHYLSISFSEIDFAFITLKNTFRNFNLLSGGEQIKILLISLFLKEKIFLLIDEPTNHLDIETRDNLVNYLKNKKVLYWFLTIEIF